MEKLRPPFLLFAGFCAILSDSSQGVKLGQELSDWVMLKGSVTQGSWLAPLLFIVLIDDLHPPRTMHNHMDGTTLTACLEVELRLGAVVCKYTGLVVFYQQNYTYRRQY